MSFSGGAFDVGAFSPSAFDITSATVAPAFSSAAFSTSAFSVNAFSFDTTPVPPTPTQDTPSGGYYEPQRRRRTKEDIRAERVALGILKEPKAAEAVAQVAAVVIESQTKPGLELKAEEQTGMLLSMLTDQGFQLRTEQAIHEILTRVIAQEIEKQEEERAIVHMLFEM